MRVIIVMAMQTTLMDQLHVLLKPSHYRAWPKANTRGQWAFKLP